MDDRIEFQAAAHRQRVRSVWAVTSAILLSVLTLVFVSVSIYLIITNVKLRTLSERSDCRSDIAGEFAEIQRQDFETLLTVVFAHTPSGSALTPSEVKLITDANDRLTALPTRAEAVAHGYTLNGKRHPACPAVR